MSHAALYSDHLAMLDRQLTQALAIAAGKGAPYEGVLFHAGSLRTYHADDHHIAHHTCAHFRRFVPALEGPDHLVLARPGRKLRVIRVRPLDYWYDTSEPAPSYFEEHVDLTEVTDLAVAKDVLGGLSSIAYVGPDADAANLLGIDAESVEPEGLMAPLDWYRAYKTEFEIALVRRACERAAAGHLAAREAFLTGATERQIHWKYLEATEHLESELPYEAIVAFDEKSAVLHYQFKRGPEAAPGRTFLLDAGAAFQGYASDVTRTWARDDVPDEFAALVRGVDAFERNLVAMVTPGRPFLEIHVETHRAIARLLHEIGVIKVEAEEAFERGLTEPFMPHGVGHQIGIQVHDVGGHQAGSDGGKVPPPTKYPALRNTRIIEPGHLLTIEPGVYFIPMLLDPLRQGPDADALDWNLIDRLTPCGGVRIEDNVFCTDNDPRDLTRDLIPGPAEASVV